MVVMMVTVMVLWFVLMQMLLMTIVIVVIVVVIAFVIIVVIVAIAVFYVISVAIFDQTMFFFLFGSIASQMACTVSSLFHSAVSSAGIACAGASGSDRWCDYA